MQRGFLLIAGLMTALMLLCCSDGDSGPGKAFVKWQLEGLVSCSEVGVDRVKISLSQDDLEKPFEITTDCSTGEATIEEVPSGDYFVAAYGLNGAGKIIFSGELLDEEGLPAEMDVASGEERSEAPEAIMLKKIKGKLVLLPWTFPEVDNPQCQFTGVETYTVFVFRSDTMDQIVQVDLPCSHGVEDAPDEYDPVRFAYVIDGMPEADVLVRVFGFDIDGAKLFGGEAGVAVPIAEEVEVQVELFKCEPGADCPPPPLDIQD
jgi:hypothetical protein